MGVRYDEAAQAGARSSAATTERQSGSAARIDPEPDRQHGRGGPPRLTTRKLEIVGVGYQAQLKKATRSRLQVGYANQIVLEAPPGVTVVVPDATHITISGADKQAVGQSPRKSARSGPPNRTRGREFATKVKPSGARRARRSARSKPSRPIAKKKSSKDKTQQGKTGPVQATNAGWASGRHRPPPNPESRGSSGEPEQTGRSPPAAAAEARFASGYSARPERPRLAFSRSSKHIYAQVINDATGTTLASASTLEPEIRAQHAYGGKQGGRRGRGRVVATRAKQAWY